MDLSVRLLLSAGMFVIYVGVILMPLCLSPPPPQVCVHSNGSPGPAADGLPLSEHQPVCGEFPEDGAKAARVRQTQPPDPWNQLCELGCIVLWNEVH